MAKVSLRNMRKIYDNPKKKGLFSKKDKNTGQGVLAVDDFSLEIEDKEFIVLVGPSGCGKSTLLRMIAGLEEITDGQLYIGDVLSNDIPPKDRDIAMVFQSYALYPQKTVRDNMAFPLELSKLDKKEIQTKVENTADILGITELLERKPKALSGGQRQRVAIGRAIVREPKVLLMDEPLSNLDAKLRNQMRAEILKLRQRIDTTFVYVTHDQTEAMTLGDRIVIMKDGFTQQVGTPQEVFLSPANIFVAGFIGVPQMNIYDGELLVEDDHYKLKLGQAYIPLPEEKQASLKAKSTSPQAVQIGVRPEHVHILRKEEVSSIAEEQILHGQVDVAEMMGSEIHLHVQTLGKDSIFILSTTELIGKKDINYQIGDTIKYTFSGSIVNIFSKETGDNLEF